MRRVRLPLIILVTYAHSYGAIREGYSLLGNGWDTYEILKILVSHIMAKVAVPAFYIMSGYLFFAHVEKFTKEVYWQKIRRRIHTLLIPYIIWNLLMAAKFNSQWPILGEYLIDIFWTPANMPLWFLRDLMIVSLATPIIYIGVSKLGWWIVAILFPIYINGIWAIQPELNPYSVCFFTLGTILSIKKVDLVETCRRFVIPACILSVILMIAMIVSYRTEVYMVLLLCFRVTSVVALFGMSNQWKHSPICDFGARASYFVYLAHYVLFFRFIDETFLDLFGHSTLSLCTHYMICPLIKVAFLFVIYYFYRFALTKTIDR